MKGELRNKLFLIIVSAFCFIFPFTLFFDVIRYSYKAKGSDGLVHTIVDYYNLVNVHDLSKYVFAFCMIIFIASLIVSIIALIDLLKKKYFTLYFRIIFSVFVVLLALITHYLSYYLMVALFMFIASHMFLIYYDIKTNKHKLSNSLIYAITYLSFLVFAIISFAFVPMY